ncbi:MAG: restriction endonuclease subunit S [Rhodospirillales bacterium]|nr:restriction endonuclease subunit S [Rhodospirillales bacterium]
MSILPKSWALVKIVDVLEPNENGKPFQQGWSPQCDKMPAELGEWGVLKTTAIQEGNFLEFENKKLPVALKPRPHLEVRAGDILMTCAGPRSRCGVTCLVDKTRTKLIMSGKMYRFRCDQKKAHPKYLEYFLHSRNAKYAIDKMKTGISDSGLNLTHGRFSELDLPIAPINEQCRIIAKIEQLFSELDNGIENLKTAREQLKIYRQAVLDSAFMKVVSSKPLSNLLSKKMTNGYSGKPVKFETKNKVLSLSSTTSGEFKPEHFKYLDEAGLGERDIWCEPNDILVQRGNTSEYVGVPAIYTGHSGEFIYPDLMIRLRANETLILTKFLYYALSSPKIRNLLRKNSKGSAGTMPKINQSILSSVSIPFCPLKFQHEIIQEIESKLSNVLMLDNEVEVHLIKSEALRQSILKKAFSGQLVAQDPNDEPASALLERIKAEKAAQVVPAKTKRKKSV